MGENVWVYDYDEHLGKWNLYSAVVKKKTSLYVFIERVDAFNYRTRLNLRDVCFSPEEAISRWVASAKIAIRLKEQNIKHLQEGIEHAGRLSVQTR